MTLREVSQIIYSCGLAYRYSHFSEDPDPPYIVYYFPSENDVFADDSNYLNRRQLFVELYTKEKDYECEDDVEAALKSAGLTWYKSTDFLNDEKLYQTTYEMEVVING